MRFKLRCGLSPAARFRRKFGIAPKGDGPHADSDYGLPLPSKGHPLAKRFARAVLARAHQAKAGGRFDAAAVDRQVRKANRILYGHPNPSASQKSRSREKQLARDVAYHFGECSARCAEAFKSRAQQGFAFATGQPWARKWGKLTKKAGKFKGLRQYAKGSTSPNKGKKRGKKIHVDSPAYKAAVKRLRKRAAGKEGGVAAYEAMVYGGIVAPPDSHEHVKDALEKAARDHPAFKSEREGDWAISVPLTFPKTRKALVTNSRTGEMWMAGYAPNEDGEPDFDADDVQPAQMSVAPKEARAAIEALRERGVESPVLMPFRIETPLREAKWNEDGSVDVLVLREGDGNLVDNNYYTSTFVESLVPLLDAADAYYDHQSAAQERDLPERSVLHKAGWYSDARVGRTVDEHGREVAGAFAKFHPRVGDPAVESLMRTSREKSKRYPGKPPFVAYSINGYGAGESGKSPRDGSDKNIIEVATSLRSVDLVTAAGAGGRPTFKEALGMEHPKGCMCTSKQCAEARRKAKEAAANANADPFDREVEGGEVTTEEAAAAVEGVKARTREAALSGPLGKQIAEALKLPAGFTLARATEKQLDAIDEHLGIKGDKFAESILSEIVEDDEDEDLGDEGGAGDGSTPAEGDEELTDDRVDEMGEDELRTELKRLRDKPDAARESLRAEVTTLRGQLRGKNREAFLNKVFAELKFPDAHREIATALVENCATPEKIRARLRAYKEASIVPSLGRGAVGNNGTVRESQGGGLTRLSTGVRRAS